MDQRVRHEALLNLVADQKRVTLAQAAKALDVSVATIRRDVIYLAGRKLLVRVRGGALASNVTDELAVRHKVVPHAAEKQRISVAASRLVEPGMVVGLNGGTTTTEVSSAVATRPEFNDRDGSPPALTVVTNALNIAHDLTLRPGITIVITGGTSRQRSFELTGPLTTHALTEITLDLAFLGVDALDIQRGAHAHHEDEADASKLMAARACHVVVVADRSKLASHAAAHICATQEIGQTCSSPIRRRTRPQSARSQPKASR